MTKVQIYTDGACRANPGPGGWAALLVVGDSRKEISGAESATTNNRMELMAAISGIGALKRRCEVDLYTDSKYVLQGITQWLPQWKAKGWRTAARKPVRNQDLWERLDLAAEAQDIIWHWVKGHSGDAGNELVDQLANRAIDRLLAGGEKRVRQIVLDTETTGLEVDKNHRIIEIGCIEMLNRRVTGRTFHQYLNPEREIDAGAQQVHGLSLERLAPEPKFAQVAPQFLEFIQGAELIIHNAPFDVAFLNAELRRLGDETADIAIICSVLDTLVLARNMHPGQRNNLDALCKRYGVDNSQRDLHGALLDARILADVYLAMTGGQAKLTWGTDRDTEREHAAAQAGLAGASGAAPGQRIPVILASAEELAAHDEALLRLDKASDGKTVWRRS